jgi:hypothetical protein
MGNLDGAIGRLVIQNKNFKRCEPGCNEAPEKPLHVFLFVSCWNQNAHSRERGRGIIRGLMKASSKKEIEG